jgi:hypothetical protein
MSVERDETVPSHVQDSFFLALRALLVADSSRLHSNLVLYTPFGIVRGRVSRQFIEQMKASNVVELDECEIEHFSSHMPSGRFIKFFVRISEIQGYTLF